MWHYLIYLALCTAAQAFSVYQPLDCLNDYQDACGAIPLGCAPRCPPSACLQAPLSLPAPRQACVPVNCQPNSNLQTIMTLLATLKNTGIVGAPTIPTNSSAPNCVPIDKVLQLLIISNSSLTFQNLVDLGIIPPSTVPTYLLSLRVAGLLDLMLLPLGNSTSGSGGLLGGLLGGDNPLLSLKLLPALLGNDGLLGGLLSGLLGGVLGGGGGGGAPGVPTPAPGISKDQFHTILLQLLASLAANCPPGTVPVVPLCPSVC